MWELGILKDIETPLEMSSFSIFSPYRMKNKNNNNNI
jgi:hypothetical protein